MNNLKQKTNWFRKESIPNWLTILRIIFVPIVVIFILISNSNEISSTLLKKIYSFKIDNFEISINVSFLIAAIFFILASITDALDGFIARKFKWVSDFGKLWDPLADKLLTNSVLICFGSLNYIPIWLTLIFVIRDVIIDGYRMLAAKSQIIVAANWYGKIKTILMMVGIIFIFFLGTNNLNNVWYYWAINNLLIYLAAMFSIASGVIYMIKISKSLKLKKVEDNKKQEEIKTNN